MPTRRNAIRTGAPGVVLSAGGFIHNRDMVEEYAPRYRKGMRVGTIGDNGSGIRLGQSVGGAVAKMENVSAWRFLNPPEAFARGILVNRRGERYINEMRYGATTGHAMVEHNGGEGFVVMDAKLKRQGVQAAPPRACELVSECAGVHEPVLLLEEGRYDRSRGEGCQARSRRRSQERGRLQPSRARGREGSLLARMPSTSTRSRRPLSTCSIVRSPPKAGRSPALRWAGSRSTRRAVR